MRDPIGDDRRPEVEQPRLFRLDFAMGTCCYSISPRGAAYVLAHCKPLGRESPALCEPPAPGAAQPKDAAKSRATFLTSFANLRQLNNGVDAELCRHYPRMAAYCCLPPLALQRFDPTGSTVQGEG